MSVAAWITGIVGAVLATALIDVIMAEGETKKFVKGIASLLVIAVIIAPLPAMFDGDFKLINDAAGNPTTETNDTYLERVYMERYKAYELAIQRKLNAVGIYEVIIRIEIDYDGGEIVVKKVTADVSQAVLSGVTSNIDINGEVTAAVIAVLGESVRKKIDFGR